MAIMIRAARRALLRKEIARAAKARAAVKAKGEKEKVEKAKAEKAKAEKEENGVIAPTIIRLTTNKTGMPVITGTITTRTAGIKAATGNNNMEMLRRKIGIKIGSKFPRLLRHNGNRSKAPYSSSPNNSNSSSNLLALSNSGRRTLVLLGVCGLCRSRRFSQDSASHHELISEDNDTEFSCGGILMLIHFSFAH